MNCLPMLVQNLRRRFGRLFRDQRGVSAVEFALLLPFMTTLYLGTVEISQGISADRKVTMTARTVADLVSQTTGVDNSGMTDILAASAAVMYPFSTNVLKVTVTAVYIDSKGKATVTWSDAYNGSARAVGSSVTLPAALVVNSSSLIWSEVQYTYKPTVGYVITGSLTLKDQLYMAPRLANCVTRPPTVTSCPSG